MAKVVGYAREDPLVLLLKQADRFHNLATEQPLETKIQRRMTFEVLDVYGNEDILKGMLPETTALLHTLAERTCVKNGWEHRAPNNVYQRLLQNSILFYSAKAMLQRQASFFPVPMCR